MSGHVEQSLIPYLRGELEPAERLELEGHLGSCARCREAREDFAALARALERAVPDPPALHWGAYRAELRDRLERGAREPGAGEGWRVRPWPAALAAGLLVILVYTGGPWLSGDGPGNGERAALDTTLLAGQLDLIERFELIQRLDLLEDLDVIGRLDGLEGRVEG